MAEIFLGYEEADGTKKPVAIKRLLPQLTQDKEIVSMFLDEARLLQQFDHPNIVSAFDTGRTKNTYFTAMEYVHGANLEAVAKRCRKLNKKWPLNLVAQIGVDVCAVLDYVHHFTKTDGLPLALIHRDISAQNVMMTYNGKVKVLDFGVAKDLGDLSRTRPAVLAGKTAYLSPEQVMQRPDLDKRTDVYSLGAVLYELTTGNKPFQATTELDTMLAIIKQPVPDAREADPAVPDELAEILLKAMAKDRRARYQTTRAMGDDLQAFLERRRADVTALHVAAFLRTMIPPRAMKKGSSQKAPDPVPKEPLPAKTPELEPSPEPALETLPESALEILPESALEALPEPANGAALELAVEPESRPVQAKPIAPSATLGGNEGLFAGITRGRKPAALWTVLALGLLAGAALAGYAYVQFTDDDPAQASGAVKKGLSTRAPRPEPAPGVPLPAAEFEAAEDPGTELVPIKPAPKAARKPRPGPRTRVNPAPEARSASLLIPDSKPADEEIRIEEEKISPEQEQELAPEPVEAKTEFPKTGPREPAPTNKADLALRPDPPAPAPKVAPAPKPTYQAPEVIKKRRIAGRDPSYPAMARKAKLRATVLVKIFIEPDGRVGFTKFLKSHPVFEKAVQEAISTWHFSPYRINDRPVGTYTVYKFVFQLN